jgi:hypothetical protein
MTNPSIFAAFERMWQHVVTLVGGKANVVHSHDDLYYTEAEVDEIVSGAVTHVQLVSWTSADIGGEE